MHQTLRIPSLLLTLTLLVASSIGLQAQATRTWVSGVGDDANPASRTAPAKTFAGAISKTAAGGEISVLDPGSFGAVTITKAITLDGRGTLAGILASGTNGIIINASATDTIIIRNLSIKNPGAGVSSPSGLHGIKIIQAGAVHVENCTIEGGTDLGISFAPSNSGARLYVKNTTITNCAGGAIQASPSSLGFATLVDSFFNQCNFGIRAAAGSKITAKNVVVAGSTLQGVIANGASQIFLQNCQVTANTTGGLIAETNGGNSFITVAGSSITDNAGPAFAVTGSSRIFSPKDNILSGNTSEGISPAKASSK